MKDPLTCEEFKRRLGVVLAAANSHPSSCLAKDCFYDFKTAICAKYAEPEGFDYQLLEKECWGDFGLPCGDECLRCGGSRIYYRRIVRLKRWRLGNALLHEPVGNATGVTPTIVGLIDHVPNRNAAVATIALCQLLSYKYYWWALQGVTVSREWNAFGKVVLRASRLYRWIIEPLEVPGHRMFDLPLLSLVVETDDSSIPF